VIYLEQAAPTSWLRLASRRAAIAAAIAMGALIWFLALAAGLGLVLGALAAAAVAVVVIWKWPAPTAAFFLAFVPVNRFVFVLVLHFTHQDLLVKGLQVWKEGVVAILLVRGVHAALTSEKAKKIFFLDLVVIAYLLISLIYLAYDGPGHLLQPIERVQGWRTDSSFLFAYFVGRGLVLNRRQLKLMLLASIPGAVAVGAVALWQFGAPTQAANFFQAVGAIDFSTLSGDTLSSSVRSRGIPGLNLTRASSLMLGDLALAFYQLFMASLGAAFYFVAGRRTAAAAFAFLLLMVATLGLTVTRSAILALPLMLGLAALLTGRWMRLLPVAGIGIAAIAIGILITHVRPELLARLWDFNEGSTQAHVALLQRSVDVISSFPWGHGLGTGGTIGTRYLGNLAIDNENWLLLQATDMGVVQSLLFLVINGAIIVLAASAYFRVRDLWLKIVTLTVTTGAVAYLFVGNFLHSWENLVVSMGFWILAGIAMKAVRLEEDADYRGAP